MFLVSSENLLMIFVSLELLSLSLYVLTAFNKDDMHVFKGYSAGAVDYVFKPIEPLILKSKVDVFVELYRKTEEIRRQGEEERRLLMENLRVRSEKLKTEQALRLTTALEWFWYLHGDWSEGRAWLARTAP